MPDMSVFVIHLPRVNEAPVGYILDDDSDTYPYTDPESIFGKLPSPEEVKSVFATPMPRRSCGKHKNTRRN